MVVFSTTYLATMLGRYIEIEQTDIWVIGRSEGCLVNGKYIPGLPF